ncbi:MAG TPA: GNAT family N-acetyltransferase [Fervidobacterium sp.]|nr:GNAT family N-acetyltransferase [Fervidobacterium sp.]HPT54231.1 GNAT family N-acetyltransferase [Fervidobacterium sp.]HPZ17531.1 GNAT family N-acetyltransferase [Fervidobacterium sp.]HQE49439.1 GNAT family N-acetyltransferase [Fervidobacterium sp.]HUM42384.1 GNAT family N-acetyltransferase [Fervidobacterium sp.]
MPDMLVKLYELPSDEDILEELSKIGIVIKRSIGPEKISIVEWVKAEFGKHWASETDVTFSNKPISCFIAIDTTNDNEIVGFACYDATTRGFFGPTGVNPKYRGKGIGTALLLACLKDMYSIGYAYAIIGDAGPTEYYKKTVGAVEIPNSHPGIYKNMVH